jgi:hypothetical protein
MIKLNWGFGITMLYLSFVAGMMYLVALCVMQNVDLVSEDYYQKELNYQQVINSKNNLDQLNSSVATILHDNRLEVIFPNEQKGLISEGEIHFYKPDNDKLDQKVAFKNLNENIFNADLSKFKKGLWRIKINWKVVGKNYYYQTDINL